jgi:beta-1,4-mannosyl-glycoprotein beta-1,4-N-acetylglucosaminyltransferase
MKIVDCFIFYNELDMLLYRLDTLFEYVDYFVIVESKYTHSGKEKELFYNNNKELFKDFNSKIVYVMLDDLPYKFPNIDYSKNQQWDNEHYQRNAIKNGIDQLQLNNEDVIIISDLDEIPDYNLLSSIKNNVFIVNYINSLEQDFYYYNLNSRMIQKWNSSKILSYKTYNYLKLSFQDIRHFTCKNITKAGWHLSYFGDKYFIQNKIQNFGHQEYNNDTYTNIDIIEKRINDQIDLYGRSNEKIEKISIKNNTYLPHNFEKHLSKYILY